MVPSFTIWWLLASLSSRPLHFSLMRGLHLLAWPWKFDGADLTPPSFLSLLQNSYLFSILSCYGHLQIPFALWISSFYSSPILTLFQQLSLFTLSDTFHIHPSQSCLPFWNDTVSPATSDNPSFLLSTSQHHCVLRSDSPPAPHLMLLRTCEESTLTSCTLHQFSLSSSLSFLLSEHPTLILLLSALVTTGPPSFLPLCTCSSFQTLQSENLNNLLYTSFLVSELTCESRTDFLKSYQLQFELEASNALFTDMAATPGDMM